MTGYDQAPGRRWLRDLGSVQPLGKGGLAPGQPEEYPNRRLAVVKEDSNRRCQEPFHLESRTTFPGPRPQEDTRGRFHERGGAERVGIASCSFDPATAPRHLEEEGLAPSLHHSCCFQKHPARLPRPPARDASFVKTWQKLAREIPDIHTCEAALAEIVNKSRRRPERRLASRNAP